MRSRLIARPLSVAVGVLILAAAALGDRHTFKYIPPDPKNPPQSVAVAGDFNGWSAFANPLKPAVDHSFEATLPLTEGVHYYKFVLNGSK